MKKGQTVPVPPRARLKRLKRFELSGDAMQQNPSITSGGDWRLCVALGMAAVLFAYGLWYQAPGLEEHLIRPLENQPACVVELSGVVENRAFISSVLQPRFPRCFRLRVSLCMLSKRSTALLMPPRLYHPACGWWFRSGNAGSAISMVEVSAAARVTFGLPLDLNVVTADELLVLPDVGPEIAQRVVAEQGGRGRYEAVAELRAGKGHRLKETSSTGTVPDGSVE